MFAQQIVPLTRDHVDVDPTKVSIALGQTVIEIPQPLDEAFRELPGFGHGRHTNATALRERLHRLSARKQLG